MNFDLHIENVGKLTDAKIRIGRFTVFAGPNNTGKSFVSKLLYSIVDTINSDPVREKIRPYSGYLEVSEYRLRGIEKAAISKENLKKIKELLFPIREEIFALNNIIKNPPFGDFNVDDCILHIRARVGKMTEVLSNTHDSILPLISKVGEMEFDTIKAYWVNLEREFSNPTEFINSALIDRIQEKLIENFQVEKPSELKGKKDVVSKIEGEFFGKCEISNEQIDFAINRVGLSISQKFSNVIYLESPVYWKLKNTLENIRFKSTVRERERLTGVPGYFYDLASALIYKYTGDIAFPKIYERLIGKNVLGGKVTMSAFGNLSFQENGRSFSMPVTAMGVTNLGILALLIERKVLDKDAFIFIDEPEAHLHPAWQVVMAETLFELAKGGVNVVIATHSADILKWLEVHIKQNPDDESLVALNKFPVQEDDEQEFKYKMAAIKRELTKPFADLYTAGL